MRTKLIRGFISARIRLGFANPEAEICKSPKLGFVNPRYLRHCIIYSAATQQKSLLISFVIFVSYNIILGHRFNWRSRLLFAL